jgi:hypothetical protein
MKFLPPEDEIRAQLRELTSQTRRLRADLQGLINDKGHSDSAFERQRRRLRGEVPLPVVLPPPAEPAPTPRPRLRQKPRKSPSSR